MEEKVDWNQSSYPSKVAGIVKLFNKDLEKHLMNWH
jgi:hypothetical protein